MAGFLKTRKRSRDDELPCESMPLSKRINNLHLNYDEGNSSSNSSNCSIGNTNNDNNNYIVPNFSAVASGLTATTVDENNRMPERGPGPAYGYNPELSVEQNPYYYAKNKMLYDLHVERVKRNTQ